jgi:hypothetical protein
MRRFYPTCERKHLHAFTVPFQYQCTALCWWIFLGLIFYVCDALGSTLAVEKASVTDVLPHWTAVVSAVHTLMKIIKVSLSKSSPKRSTDIVTPCNSKRFFIVVKFVLLCCTLEINTRRMTILLVTRNYWNMYRMIGSSRDRIRLGRIRKMLQQHIGIIQGNSSEVKLNSAAVTDFRNCYWCCNRCSTSSGWLKKLHEVNAQSFGL